MYKILVVDDEVRMRKLIKDYFKREGFEVSEADNGISALDTFNKGSFDLIILDIMMPFMDGYAVCKEIRKKSTIPIIFLTAKSEDEDKLTGYSLEADDYMTKPFSPKILVAKAKAIIKRNMGLNDNNKISINGIVIDEASYKVTVNEEELTLSKKEYEILLYFLKNKNIVLTRENLIENIWGYDFEGEIRTVDTLVKRLREKLLDKADMIVTVRGVGYKFEVKA
ncbi:MAG: response regulator transcription factor [Bacillota bacterium]|nr:response regulator transcription factor [Bacillota bacterium]